MRPHPPPSCIVCFVLGWCFAVTALAQEQHQDHDDSQQLPSIEEKTRGMQKQEGFLAFYRDELTGSIFLEIDDWDEDLIYVSSLVTGLGSNPVGLDRGQLGSTKVVRFHRVGPKVLLVQRNLRFRAITDKPLEQQAVQESFAESIIWGGKVAASTNATALIEISSLLLSDSHHVIQTLAERGQGEFSLDETRSAVALQHCKGFPDNTELESFLTFTSRSPGNDVKQTAPSAHAVSFRTHHSFVRLPDDGYTPRKYDVRSPCIFITYADYASPLDAPLQKRLIVRHRLKKKDPRAAVSEPTEPIIYYVDPGAPQEIQKALMEGARWWDAAFESAGFKNAFQVKLLPADAHPLDVRYNVIQWVHRSTRGWSYGNSVVDPRTGEIIKGHVTLGSLRVRQDQLLLKGLQPVASSSAGCNCCGIVGVVEDTSLADFDEKNSALEVALARIRQLAAHEVGHTLGFVHNFAASTYGERASVMDYPAPKVMIQSDDQLDLSDAYGVGIGAWDKLSVQFAYRQFDESSQEAEALDKLLQQARSEGMIFLSDADARPPGAAHPLGNLWDNGADPIEQLRHVMQVRRIALQRFDPGAMPPGTTTADIAQYLTPLYLHHRYQLQAAGKMIGGYEYEYGYAGQASPKTMIPAERQKRAIRELISTLHPRRLRIPEKTVAAITPRPYSTFRDHEILPAKTGRIFDPLAAAAVAADLTLAELFQHERLGNLTLHARRAPSLAPVVLVPQMVERIWDISAAGDETENAQIGRIVRAALLEKLIHLVDHGSASVDVRSAALLGIQRFAKAPSHLAEKEESAFLMQVRRKANQVLERPYPRVPEHEPLEVPPGSPIGLDR